MTRTLLTICIVTAQLSAGAARSAAQDKTEGGVDLDAMAQDVKIMERVLDQALNKHFKKSEDEQAEERDAKAAAAEVEAELAREPNSAGLARTAELYNALAAVNTRLGSSRVRTNIEGFYVPGTGVIYTLDVPVFLKRDEKSADHKPATVDLWSQAENELHEKATKNLWFGPRQVQRERYIVDEDGLNQTIDVLIDTVAKYGSRIGQLSGGESIILAARVKSRGTRQGAGSGDRFMLEYMQTTTTSRRVIVTVPVSVLRDFSAGKMTPKECRDRAEVTQYRSHDSDVTSNLYTYTTGTSATR